MHNVLYLPPMQGAFLKMEGIVRLASHLLGPFGALGRRARNAHKRGVLLGIYLLQPKRHISILLVGVPSSLHG